jgi:hypothetical protein
MTTDPTNADLVRRIRALLAKAQATEFPEEAEAFLAKAQELASRHAIDSGQLRDSPGDQVTTREIRIPGPYASARTALLIAVARNNHCRVLTGRAHAEGQLCLLVGFDADIDLVVQLHAQFALHAAEALAVAPMHGERPRSFRHAFLLAYAHRIDARLRVATEAACTNADDASSAALILRRRRDLVDEAVAARFPRLRRASASSISSGDGYVSGERAAEQAGLGHRSLGEPRGLPRGGA